MATPKEYTAIKESILSRDPHDRGFCGPVAISVLTGIQGAEVVHTVSHLRQWRHGGGMRLRDILVALKSFGVSMELDGELSAKVKTPITAARVLRKGSFLCVTRDHVFAVKNGRVIDWTDGRRHRVIGVYKII